MNFDLHRIFESKHRYRQRLASLPISEKLRMLDVMAERDRAIGGATMSLDSRHQVIREESTAYGKPE